MSPISFGIYGFIIASLALGLAVRSFRNRRQARMTFAGRNTYEQSPQVVPVEVEEQEADGEASGAEPLLPEV
jgi:hypothetical protein